MKRILFIFICSLFLACTEKAIVEKNIIANIPSGELAIDPKVKLSRDSFTIKVDILFEDNAVCVSELPQGITAEANGTHLLVRSCLPGVEYVVRGKTDNGSLVVVSEKSPLVTLDSLDIHSIGKNALSVSSKEIIYIAGTEAILSDEMNVATGKVEKQAAVLSLMGDAVICDGADICLQATRRDAINATGILYIDDAAIVVDYAAGSAVNAVKGVVVADGCLKATAIKDIVKVKSGNFVMLKGEVQLGAAADKADAIVARNIYTFGGTLIADVQGAAAKGLKSKESVFLAGGEVKIHTSGGALFSEKKGDYSSSSCVKSTGNTYIGEANVSLVSDGDAGKGINCDGLLQIDGGIVSVKTTGNDVNHPIDLNAHASAKGIKCDSTIFIKGGNIEVLVCGKGTRCEGMESKDDIIITGEKTKIYIYAWDDAINAANVSIDNGKLYAFSVTNDGIDSNGDIDISGGVIIANGSHSPELGIDVDNAEWLTIRGGTVLSVGGSMDSSPCLPLGRDTKGLFASWVGIDVKAGEYISVADSNGKTLLSYCLPRSMHDVAFFIASPLLHESENYSFFMSDSIDGGVPVGCGLYNSADIIDATHQVDWVQSSNCVIIDKEGNANPSDKMKRSLPPPPPNGKFPMGPPPPDIKGDFADTDILPIKGW